MDYLIAGLGNVGEEYAATRHNIGFMTLDHIARRRRIDFTLKRAAYTAEFRLGGSLVRLIKPAEYMNRSGNAISRWLSDTKTPKGNLLVVVDDLAIPFGKLRLRSSGGAGGHNGLADIEARLGGSDYARLRVGIGASFNRGEQVNYVLSAFNAEERPLLPALIEQAEQAIYSFCTAGIERAASMINAL